MKNFISNILKDVKTELTDEFNMNFRRKAFFDQPWKQTRMQNSRGSLMMRSGKLSGSIRGAIQANTIHWNSAMKYASIHNEGGTITVTDKMIKFFWAMYYKSSKASGGGSKERQQTLSVEAQQWKAMALMKVGTKIKIEKRQFIGWHPSMKPRINTIVNNNLKEFEGYLKNKLKR